MGDARCDGGDGQAFVQAVGGLVLGVGLSLINGYVTFIHGSFSLTAALVLIVIVLTVRPAGLYGTRRLERV